MPYLELLLIWLKCRDLSKLPEIRQFGKVFISCMFGVFSHLDVFFLLATIVVILNHVQKLWIRPMFFKKELVYLKIVHLEFKLLYEVIHSMIWRNTHRVIYSMIWRNEYFFLLTPFYLFTEIVIYLVLYVSWLN